MAVSFRRRRPPALSRTTQPVIRRQSLLMHVLPDHPSAPAHRRPCSDRTSHKHIAGRSLKHGPSERRARVPAVATGQSLAGASESDSWLQPQGARAGALKRLPPLPPSALTTTPGWSAATSQECRTKCLRPSRTPSGWTKPRRRTCSISPTRPSRDRRSAGGRPHRSSSCGQACNGSLTPSPEPHVGAQ